MHSWLFFLTLIADTSCIILFLDFAVDLPFELAPKLTSFLAQLCSRYHTWTPDSLFEAGKSISAKHPCPIKRLGRNYNLRKVMIDESPKETDAKQTLSTASQLVERPRSVSGSRRQFGAPIAKGPRADDCPIHNGRIAGCATFFSHRSYDYKLLEDGQLFIRRSGSDAYRFAKRAILQPGQPFLVSLDDSGNEGIILCFGTSHRILGEIDSTWAFLPIQTFCFTDNESSELSLTSGQGCTFNRVYSDSSVGVPSGLHYDARYGVGWTCFSDEHRFEELPPVSDDCPEDCSLSPGRRTPLENSIHGIDLAGNYLSDYTGAGPSFAHVYHVEVELNNPLPAPPAASSSGPSTLPVPLIPSLTNDTTPAGPASSSRSVMRRTCTICQRVMRRPSALAIHMNAHLGIRPYKCDICSYSSTNITNLQRHQRTTGHGGGSSAGEI